MVADWSLLGVTAMLLGSPTVPCTSMPPPVLLDDDRIHPREAYVAQSSPYHVHRPGVRAESHADGDGDVPSRRGMPRSRSTIPRRA